LDFQTVFHEFNEVVGSDNLLNLFLKLRIGIAVHIRKLNRISSIVILAEAGIHSGKHDGFLPSQSLPSRRWGNDKPLSLRLWTPVIDSKGW